MPVNKLNAVSCFQKAAEQGDAQVCTVPHWLCVAVSHSLCLTVCCYLSLTVPCYLSLAVPHCALLSLIGAHCAFLCLASSHSLSLCVAISDWLSVTDCARARLNAAWVSTTNTVSELRKTRTVPSSCSRRLPGWGIHGQGII